MSVTKYSKPQSIVRKNTDIYSLKTLPVKSLLLIVIVQLFTHASYLPFWLTVFVILVCLYRFIIHIKLESSISGTKKNLLFLSSFAVFILHYKFNLTVEMAAAFLFLMTSLKLVEVKSKVDVVVASYTLMFLVSVSFLFDQGIIQTVVQVIALIMCLFVLLQLNLGTDFRFIKVNVRYIRKGVLRAILISVPIFISLFLFFPRLAPLWTMPLDLGGSKTGFGNTVAPGDISKLTRSSEVAFRVTFSSEPLENKHLYWRGLVLDEFDGREWKQSSSYSRKETRVFRLQDANGYDSYRVILEPHFEKWIFALDGSFAGGDNLSMLDMGLFNMELPVIQATSYKMYFDKELLKNYRDGQLVTLLSSDVKRIEREAYQDLQLPARALNPRTRKYVKELLLNSSSDYDLLKKILLNFREREYFYSLEPPALGKHLADDFLFGTRQGFCEHYASVVAYMLRLAGIPSRVIVGYQGGEFNAGGDYMVVRQYDAHAWVEAKLDKVGWVRIDPTSMVAPERILSGGVEAFAEESAFLADSLIGSIVKTSNLLSWFESSIDEIKFAWQNIVVNYDQDEQSLFVSALLGEFSALNSILLLVYLLIVFIIVFALYLFLRNGVLGMSVVELKYKAWSRVLRRLGYQRNIGETPRQFLDRLKSLAPVWMFNYTKYLTVLLEEQQYKK